MNLQVINLSAEIAIFSAVFPILSGRLFVQPESGHWSYTKILPLQSGRIFYASFHSSIRLHENLIKFLRIFFFA